MSGSPHWSPDGSKVVFDSNVEGQFEVDVIDATGGRPQRRRCIYFSSSRGASQPVAEVWQNQNVTEPRPRGSGYYHGLLGAGPENACRWPRTGDFHGRRQIWFNRPKEWMWSVPVDGGAEKQILKTVGLLNSAFTDHGVYFVDMCGTSRCRKIDYLDFATGITLVATGKVGEGLSISPDRKFLLYSQFDQAEPTSCWLRTSAKAAQKAPRR